MFRRDDDTLLFFTGTDLWRQGSFSFGGGVWSPGGIDREGFTFKLLAGAGSYQYLSGALGDVEVTGRQFTGFAMAGYRFVRDKLFVTVFAGVDVQYHWFTPYDPTNNLRGPHAGIRGAIEFWYEPDALTMWAADASVDQRGTELFGARRIRLAPVRCVLCRPRSRGFAGGDTYKQWRAGIHVTGFRSGASRMVARRRLGKRFQRA